MDAAVDDLLETMVGEPDREFIDSQENIEGGRESSCDNFSSSDGEDDDNDNDLEINFSLEDMLWPLELLHGPRTLEKK